MRVVGQSLGGTSHGSRSHAVRGLQLRPSHVEAAAPLQVPPRVLTRRLAREFRLRNSCYDERIYPFLLYVKTEVDQRA